MVVTRRKASTTARLRNGAHQRVDDVADSIDSLRSKANDYVEQGRERATEFAHSFEDTIRERPITAILISTAVGFLLGCCMMRR